MAYGRVLIMQTLISVAVPSQTGNLTYDGNSKTPTWNDYDPAVMTIGGVYRNQIDAGTYYAEFSLAIGYCWEDGSTGTKTVAWVVDQQKLDVPAVSDTTQIFDGTTKNPTISTYDKNLISVSGDSGVNVGDYTITFSLSPSAKKNYCWRGGTTTDKTKNWNIVAKALSNELSTFSQSGTLIFDSTTQTVTIAGYDERYHVLGGVTSGFDAKTYNATVSPKAGYTFANGSTDAITVQWKIDFRVLDKPAASQTAFDYGNSINIADYVSNYDAKYMTIGGTTTAQTEPNSYETTYTLKNSSGQINIRWRDNTTAAVKISWSIGAMRIPKPTLKSDVPLVDGVASYPYTGSTIELGVDNFVSAYMTRANYSGTNVKSYTATYTLSNTKKAIWDDGSTDPVKIAWAIYKKNSLTVPTVTGKTYSGSTINATISTYDTTLIEIVADSSVKSATDVGEYQIVFRLKRPQYDTWNDNSTGDKIVKWYIKMQFEVPTLPNKPYTGSLVTQEYSSDYIDMVGETSGTVAKTYTAIFTLKDTTLYEWSDGTNTPKFVEWAIEMPRLVSLLHFDDENDILKDECGLKWTLYSQYVQSPICVDGKFGKAITTNSKNNTSVISPTKITLGEADFTMDFWICLLETETASVNAQLYLARSYAEIYDNLTPMLHFYVSLDGTVAKVIVRSCPPSGSGGSAYKTQAFVLSKGRWHHFATCYDNSNGLVRCFLNGKKIDEHSLSFDKRTVCVYFQANKNVMFDEFRVVNNIAQWTEDFTPPNEPYRVEDYIGG